MVVRKNVSISEAQNAFLKRHSISLSKLAQRAIEERMEDLEFARITEQRLAEMDRGEYEELDADEFLRQVREW